MKKQMNMMRKEIERTKRKLAKQSVYENFGQKEYRAIFDKYYLLMIENYYQFSKLMNSFEEWLINYTGR